MHDLSVQTAEWALERNTLLSIRCEVFVREQGVPLELEEDASDPVALHLLAWLPGAGAIGTARLLPDGHIGRMAVRAPFRGRGVGSVLLDRLLREAAKAGIQVVLLNAQCSAQDFYARFGFTAEGEPFDDAGIPHRRMRRPVAPQR